MNFPISRAQLQNITKDYERIHRQNCINSAVEHIKKLIIEKAYMDSHNKTAGLIPRIVNTSDTLIIVLLSPNNTLPVRLLNACANSVRYLSTNLLLI